MNQNPLISVYLMELQTAYVILFYLDQSGGALP